MYERAFQILADGTGDIYASLHHFPNECPYCHRDIIPKFLNSYREIDHQYIYATLLCPNVNCDQPFISAYNRLDSTIYGYQRTLKYTPIEEKFSDDIVKISPQFFKIYNEAYFADQNGLFEICGVGYRKALEFLLKDFLIVSNPDKKENIVKMTIANCISTYVDDSRLKSTASRAIWLGNDHTHYERKWNNKDLTDLKILIRLTVNWIDSELLTKKFEAEMKSKK